jgi:class 3 adenylate cyclase/tetratricopeptide (TPR) repeat protein
VRFCGECGSPLETDVAVAPPPSPRAPAAERRLVSVLFADLVGFTSASEGRDAEETRELLGRYFETARTVIERYGGTVEKFIGDAVMAVWGTPVAQEDDAERAVRAALELVGAIGDVVPEVEARAGVLTGEAAVTLGAQGQGMVAGDLVNTASRIQSAADPGQVLVGEATRRATEAAIAFESAGEHELKGKTDRVTLWRALRVTAGVGGALRSVGLETPFVGRERELRLVKELFHACADDRKAHLVSVIGIAGVGKSRLGWEFFKYVDGVSEGVWWHRGRCLAYGEGVAFWALAEMVRMRARITEGEDPDSAREKLRSAIEEQIADEDEIRFVEPRLLHLLGLEEEGASRGKEELFGAWRLLFERMSATSPVVLLFEDLQWADAALVEFISYLLEWSRDFRIYVICLARPEAQERHSAFGQASRNQTTLFLEPLSAEAMEELLDGLVPGLPAELRERILSRAEGVPLYAVETIRMLLDRGLLVQEGSIYRPTGSIEELEVPETLQGLISARLDGLAPEERRLLQDASVLGKTFSKEALAGVAGFEVVRLEPLLTSLVRKEVLRVHVDPRAPERGQYGFLQDLVRRVAYDTLSRRDRKSRHLAAAEALRSTFGDADQEIAEVVAAHYVAAYDAQPDADDALQIKASARELLTRAGERAGSLAARVEARRYFERAAELAEDPLERAHLLERVGVMALSNTEYAEAERAFTEAEDLLDDAEEPRGIARLSGRLAQVEGLTGRGQAALERLEQAYAAVATDEPDPDVTDLAARLGQMYVYGGDFERAEEPLELALATAQAQRLPEPLVRALLAKSLLVRARGRPEEELALMRHALRYALENDLPEAAGNAYSFISDACFLYDRYGEALDVQRDALALARRVGIRRIEMFSLAELSYALAMTGGWDEAIAARGELPDELLRTSQNVSSVLSGVLEIHLHRGEIEAARDLLSHFDYLEDYFELQDRAIYRGAQAAVLFVEGDHEGALTCGQAAVELADTLGLGQQAVKQGFVWAVEAALALGERERADEMLTLVESRPLGLRPPFLEAQAHRFRARMTGEDAGLKVAAASFREHNFPFWLAVTELERAEWLERQGRSSEAQAPLDEAREIFERLEAKPWLERLARIESREPTEVA